MVNDNIATRGLLSRVKGRILDTHNVATNTEFAVLPSNSAYAQSYMSVGVCSSLVLDRQTLKFRQNLMAKEFCLCENP